ncbi:MFS general substrate transporter [Sistotremastrum niveocremeum HHB9708]|uniref:MFS general substrate transporter n=2 Tax=Sistotremastraceae TaxID=3402574 RepID=A0A165AMW0_9AGAM|nr:MFS general substrate transporter [Sistotremastrum niveocremeum HHB9708]KZT36969.1 putative MFS multidrug transporter [Sistotremastrum suecicum HHB10207 ss-3]
MAMSSSPQSNSNIQVVAVSNHQTSGIQDGCDYAGSGSREDPFIVTWGANDPGNPRDWSLTRKWILTYQLAMGTFTASFGSSCYSAGVSHTTVELGISQQVAILGLSLYVLGFGLGPLVFAPLSEVSIRRPVFLATFGPFTLLHLGGSLGQNAPTLIITRLLAGMMGSSPMTNAGGGVADLWSPKDRALATALYSMGPFLGPTLGPIVGGVVADSRLTWRFNFWLMFIFSGTLFLLGLLNMRETYAPVLLRRRARKLHKNSNYEVYYVSVYDADRPPLPFLQTMSLNLQRPFIMLAKEPIVTVLAIYVSMVYATLYAFFAAFPIVFQEHKGFSTAKGGLAFIGIGIGNMVAVGVNPITRALYRRSARKSPDGVAPPEARLMMGMLGGIVYPVGLLWFAWTTFPSIPAIVPIIAGFPFGFGMLLIFNSISSYLMDAYPIYCASALASTVVLRSVLAALFPFFTTPMYKALGDQWATSVFAFASILCMPMPFLFYRHGPWLRSKSPYAGEGSQKETLSQGPRSANQEEKQDENSPASKEES